MKLGNHLNRKGMSGTFVIIFIWLFALAILFLVIYKIWLLGFR